MTAAVDNRYPSAVLFSVLMHGAVIALLLVVTSFVRSRVVDAPHVFELVAGEGDNFSATEAPALGVPGGVKVDVPEPVRAEAPPAAPAEVAPPPFEAVPLPAPVPKPVDPAGKIVNTLKNIVSKDRRNTAKIRADEARKAKEEELRSKQVTKQQFDQQNKGKPVSTAKTNSDPKIPKVDGEGIAKGVVNGSTANTKGGGGGKATSRESGEAMAEYYEGFKNRVMKALEPPPGLSDTLMAKVTVTISASGTISNASITKSSGSDEFDRAVLAALGRVRMPARPDRRTDAVSFDVRLHDISNG